MAGTNPLERVLLPVADGSRIPVNVARPSTRPQTAILVLQEAYGATQFTLDLASRFADAGCIALVPEFYHRSNISAFPYSDRELKTALPHLMALKDLDLLADIRAAYTWLINTEEIAAARIAAVGFCIGGKIAYLANAYLPLPAIVAFYGTNIAPHLLDLAAQQHGAGLYFWAGHDDHAGRDYRRTLEDALIAANKPNTHTIFSEAHHGFFCHERPWCYDEASAREAWVAMLEFFRNTGVLDAERR